MKSWHPTGQYRLALLPLQRRDEVGVLAIIISVLALLATFCQLYLQRLHNERSLKPLGQIDLPDHDGRVAVYIRNNGLGPLIIDRLTFVKDGQKHTMIENCLDLDPKSYMRVSVQETMKRVVLPNAYLIVFEARLKDGENETELDHVRNQLSLITLRVEGRDIYDNKITLERGFQWFARHSLQ